MEASGLLECKAVSLGEWLRTLRRTVVSASPGSSSNILRIRSPNSTKDLHPQQHRCDNLKSRNVKTTPADRAGPQTLPGLTL